MEIMLTSFSLTKFEGAKNNVDKYPYLDSLNFHQISPTFLPLNSILLYF